MSLIRIKKQLLCFRKQAIRLKEQRFAEDMTIYKFSAMVFH